MEMSSNEDKLSNCSDDDLFVEFIMLEIEYSKVS